MKIANPEFVQWIEHHLERHYRHLEQIVSAIADTKETEQYERKPGVVQLDGNGNGTDSLQVPNGYDWILQRITVASTGNGQCILYENVAQPSNVLEVIGSTQLYSDGFANNLYVPSGSRVVIAFTGAGANGQGAYNLQIKLLKRSQYTANLRAVDGGGM